MALVDLPGGGLVRRGGESVESGQVCPEVLPRPPCVRRYDSHPLDIGAGAQLDQEQRHGEDVEALVEHDKP